MSAIEDLLTLADAYGSALGVAEGTVSERVLHGGNRLRDLRSGKSDIGVRRVTAAICWFSANWPTGVPWPKGVARPNRSPEPAEPAA